MSDDERSPATQFGQQVDIPNQDQVVDWRDVGDNNHSLAKKLRID